MSYGHGHGHGRGSNRTAGLPGSQARSGSAVRPPPRRPLAGLGSGPTLTPAPGSREAEEARPDHPTWGPAPGGRGVSAGFRPPAVRLVGAAAGHVRTRRVSTRREDAAASLSPDTAGRPLPRGPRDLGITVLPPLAGGGRECGPSAPLGTFACGQLRAEHRGPGGRQEAAGPRATLAKGGVPTGGQALGGGRYSRRCGPPAGSCVMGLLRTGPAGHPSPLGTPAKLAPPPAAPPPPSSHLCACCWLPPPRQASPLEFSVLLSLSGLPSWPTFSPPPYSSSLCFPRHP